MTKPRIGITTVLEQDGTELVPQPYLDALTAAGAEAVPISVGITAAQAAQLAQELDGLVYPGGPGITRGLVGSLPEDLRPVEAARDSRDALLYEAFNNNATRPILGICYGMQFVNAMHGGTIYGDASAQLEQSDNHSSSRGAQPHAINLVPESHLHRIFHLDAMEVNTYHIQALASVGEGLRVSATAPDGIIEGIESLDGRILGVQFHPERMGEDWLPLFKAFVARCQPGSTSD